MKRNFLFLVSGVQLLLAIAFILQIPFVVNLWPFEGTTPLTYIFLGSILAAASASTFQVAYSGNFGAMVGIGIDYIFIMLPAAFFAFQLGGNKIPFGIVALFSALFGIGLVVWSRRYPITDSPPLPAPVRWSFIGFIVALLLVAIPLILQVPNVIPWKITPELSVLIGWMFLGAATYFVYALVKPSWYNAAGQLAGFLAYDIVLIIPFLQRLPTVAPEHQLGLYIYTAVVVYSGLLAIYYLFINKKTRVEALHPAVAPSI